MTGVEWTNLIRRTENVFFHLIEKAVLSHILHEYQEGGQTHIS